MSQLQIVEGKPKEKTTELAKLGPRDVFRQYGTKFAETMNQDDGPCFYMVLTEKKNNRTRVMDLSTGTQKEMPDDTVVIPHDAKLEIFPNK